MNDKMGAQGQNWDRTQDGRMASTDGEGMCSYESCDIENRRWKNAKK